MTVKCTRTASQGVLQHITRYACLWLNQQEGKTNLKNTNISDIKHKREYFQPFLTTSVGAFHVAYTEETPEARQWRRFRSGSGSVDFMSQIKGDISGRTSKERYEQLILEL